MYSNEAFGFCLSNVFIDDNKTDLWKQMFLVKDSFE
jgi:hypothetical protein